MFSKNNASVLIANSNRHPQHDVAEDYQFNLSQTFHTEPLARRRVSSRVVRKPHVMDEETIQKEEEKDAEKIYAWTDWTASIFGDLTDIVFALQPFFHLSLLVIFPYVGLVPVMLGFMVKLLFAAFELLPEFNDKNKEEGGWLMRRMVIALAPFIIVLSFVTVVAVLSKPVMMATIGLSIAVEIAYLGFNLVTSIRRHSVAKKENSHAETALYESLTPEQHEYLLKDKALLAPGEFQQRFKQLMADSFAFHENNLMDVMTHDEESELGKHFFGESHPEHTTITPEKHKALFTPQQLKMYEMAITADKNRKLRRYDILDRSHILTYSIVQLTGAVLLGLALILFPQVTIPTMAVVGSVLLATGGCWALLDKVNYHPMKWLVNKLFNNAMSDTQHGEFELCANRVEQTPPAPSLVKTPEKPEVVDVPVQEVARAVVLDAPLTPPRAEENAMERISLPAKPAEMVKVSGCKVTMFATKNTPAQREEKEISLDRDLAPQTLTHRHSFLRISNEA